MNAPLSMFQYNQDAGIKAGVSDYITESGAYAGKLSTKWTKGKSPSLSEALELSLTAPEGKVNFLSVWYKKKDGTENASGVAMINAIMGITQTRGLTLVKRGDDEICPELEGKDIGFVLQKTLQTKQGGGDTYKFEIRLPFHPQTKKTLKELIDNQPAAAVATMLETLHDKDERNKSGNNHQYQPQGGSLPYNTEEIDPFDKVNW